MKVYQTNSGIERDEVEYTGDKAFVYLNKVVETNERDGVVSTSYRYDCVEVETPTSFVDVAAAARAFWARDYLSKTDWYAARFAETGVAIPQEILDMRAAARAIL